MPRHGGSATIYGVLYQILGTVDRAVQLEIRAKSEGDELVDAQIVIEPTGGGGDLQVHTGCRREIEQWKARSGNRRWSLREIIEQVLPDLYRAVDEEKLKGECVYRFVTGAHHCWRYQEEAFFATFADQPVPDEPAEHLDNAKEVRFFQRKSEACTHRALFERIVRSVRGDEDLKLTRRKLWHLLAHFEIRPALSVRQLETRIDEWLLDWIECREDIPEKRRALCSLILELAAEGGVRITPREFLRRGQLTAKPLVDWSRVSNRPRELLRDLAKTLRYNAELDVRKPPAWPADRHVLVITGESGQGKSWQLGSLHKRPQETGPLVLVRAKGDASRDLDGASFVVWNQWLKHDGPLPLDVVARRLVDGVTGVRDPLVTVLVDDVQGTEEVARLIEWDWATCRMRLAMTAPPAVAHAMAKRFPDQVHLVEVPDFSQADLLEYLRRQGRDWRTIPQDVRETLRRPLLASLYCAIAEDWSPTNEYELYERFWHRLSEEREQPDYPHDVPRLLALALSIFREGATYPWDYAAQRSVGLDGAAVRRLESIGILHRLANGSVEIWHPRLLNWAVAEGLVNRWRGGEMTTEELGKTLAERHRGESAFSGRRLDYVPMDALWLASDPEQERRADVPQLIVALEEGTRWAGYPERLYRDLLATLGKRIIPALVERVRATANRDFNPFPRIASQALVRIGRKQADAVRAWAVRLIGDPSPELQEMALRLLARFPSVDVLDEVWRLHVQHVGDLEQRSRKNRYTNYDLSFAAMRACIRLRPAWLGEAIANADENEAPVWELAYLLASLDRNSADQLWIEVKQTLLRKVPKHKYRSLALCTRRFRDRQEVHRLEEWLDCQDDLLAPAALQALASIDPDRALRALDRLAWQVLHPTRDWWLPELLLQRPGATQAALRQIMEAAGDNVDDVAAVYTDRENSMDAATVDVLLEVVLKRVDERLVQEPSSKEPHLWSLLDLLAKISRDELLQTIQAKAGTPFEEKLASLACCWVGRSGRNFDHELESTRQILLKIGGIGLTRLVNCELGSADHFSRLRGLRWAVVRPDSETARLLRRIAQSDYMGGHPPHPLEQYHATYALAVLGDDRAVVDSIIRWGGQVVSPCLTELRLERQPMRDEDIRHTLPLLENPESRINALWVLALSGRRDHVQRVREVFADSEEGTELSRVAMHALGDLRDGHPDTVKQIASRLRTPDQNHRYAAALALSRIGTDDARRILEQDQRDRRRRQIEEFPLLEYNQFLEELGGLDEPEAQERLRHEAFAHPEAGIVRGSRATAIRGLAKFDPDSAFAAAEIALAQDNRNRELLPAALIELDVERAVLILSDRAPAEPQEATRWAIGRALRHSNRPSLVCGHIRELLISPEAARRRAGAQLAGWQGPGFLEQELKDLALREPNLDAWSASHEALLRQESEREAIRLVNAMKSANVQRRWSILEAVIELADPYLLANRKDPLWIGQVLGEMPIEFAHHAQERLKKRMDDLKSIAQRADRWSEDSA